MKFLELKAKRSYRFIVFKIEETSYQVVVEKLGQPNEKYDDLVVSLPPSECRYAVFDLDFTTDENCQKSKIVFIAWAPDSSELGAKWYMPAPKIDSGKSWTVFRLNCRLLI
ncbi:hypothetical protein ES288_A09G226400v1 [Gossypium darwinii]|nr:hypothetical protein ES288_A09G226400v1 [Gossypium darwinii]